MTNTRPVGNLSVNPASGYYDAGSNPVDKFAIPQGISTARHQDGYQQQTFLGASIRSFTVNAGFGDSVTTLNVELVNDEFNNSDETGLGDGDDIYHSGLGDGFNPPPIGSPVFFKFGKKKSSVLESFNVLYKEIYGATAGEPSDAAKETFCFGGILQSFVENRSENGNPLFSVQVVDPREILSNVTIIMNGYCESVLQTHNLFNLYGFLEFNQTLADLQSLQGRLSSSSVLTCNNGVCTGNDLYWSDNGLTNIATALKEAGVNNVNLNAEAPVMPITGTGFSRRTPQGMPYYRIRHGLSALMGLYGKLPRNYINAGFAGKIKFRGINYMIDFGGWPTGVPDYYCMDFDQINLLDLCLEVCNITNHELFVSLLPITNNPICQHIAAWNTVCEDDELIGGIIRIDSINKSYQPQYGQIAQYLASISGTTPIENQDTGFELTNVSTDKFVTGGQEVDMYFFSANNDRGNIETRSGDNSTLSSQWELSTMFRQQILPYYGMIGEAVTIPKGFGAYKQILLDSSSLYAAGVGNYYVATEMELRAASISYDVWANFLEQYNDIYAEELTGEGALAGGAVNASPPISGPEVVVTGPGVYGVSVPRSVWPPFSENYEPNVQGKVSTPVLSCHPPYGYPLYFKRAEKLGVNGRGLTSIQARLTSIITDMATIYGPAKKGNTEQFRNQLSGELKQIENSIEKACGDATQSEQYRLAIFAALKAGTPIGLVESSAAGLQKTVSQLQQQTKENSIRVYNWLKKIADECLGKKFLVKIPREPNPRWNKEIAGSPGYSQGPFGFRPRVVDSGGSSAFNPVLAQRLAAMSPSNFLIQRFLSTEDGAPQTVVGALQVNWNPIETQWATNYIPEPQGGYVDFDLLKNFAAGGNRNLAISQGLMPIDLSPLLNGNRLSAYARFDHSEDLQFDNVSSSEYTQQTLENGYFIPDVIRQFDNVPSSFGFFPQGMGNTNNAPIRSPSVAFVKCDLDDKLYFAPKTANITANIHGTNVIDIGAFPIKPVKVLNQETCECQTRPRLYEPFYVPAPVIGGTIGVKDFIRRNPVDVNGQPIAGGSPSEYETKLKNLDPYQVYALITLPSQIVPKRDSRFREGPLSEVNSSSFTHLVTMDVVKRPEFQSPGYINSPSTWPKFKSTLAPSTVVAALNARKAALDHLQLGSPSAFLQLHAPSPVYPDLVALPLRSTERCYGPWISSYFGTNRKTNIGGRVDFVKDENLTPWNFNGYDLMNAAGSLQASFSNSLLTHVERGGAVIPGAPTGVYLGRYLNGVGPLLTNLSVDVSPGGLKSTFKFDLYTVSFGKLAKNKQEQIAMMSRERQKLQDERNALIRKGIGKAQSNISFTKIYNTMNQGMNMVTQSLDTISVSVAPDTSKTEQMNNTFGSMTSYQAISNIAGKLEPDQISARYGRTASAQIGNIFLPIDESYGANPLMHGRGYGIDYKTYNSQLGLS
jgi:hypothetical protein